jgi:hypothetical protein
LPFLPAASQHKDNNETTKIIHTTAQTNPSLHRWTRTPTLLGFILIARQSCGLQAVVSQVHPRLIAALHTDDARFSIATYLAV